MNITRITTNVKVHVMEIHAKSVNQVVITLAIWPKISGKRFLYTKRLYTKRFCTDLASWQ